MIWENRMWAVWYSNGKFSFVAMRLVDWPFQQHSGITSVWPVDPIQIDEARSARMVHGVLTDIEEE